MAISQTRKRKINESIAEEDVDSGESSPQTEIVKNLRRVSLIPYQLKTVVAHTIFCIMYAEFW